MGGGLIEAIGVKLVELIVAQTNYLAYTITFTNIYYCSDFFINIVLFSILRGKGAFFNGLYNIINFIKDWAEIAYILYIGSLNLFILIDNPLEVPFVIALATTQLYLYKKGVLAKATIETWYKRL